MIDRYRIVHCRSRLCSPAFVDDHCYRFYETRLLNLLRPLQLQLQAYCLLPGEVYLLVSPLTPLAVAHLLRSLNRSYSEYFSIRFARTGRVWHSGYREIKLRQGQTLLDCQKYIERLPMRRLGHGHPGAHAWSSYCRNAFGQDRYLHPSPGVQKLRGGKRGSCARYRNFVASEFPPAYEQHLEQMITA